MTALFSIRPIAPGQESACERVLRRLPEWFGIESWLRQYAQDTQRFPTWLAVRGDSGDAVGFITLHQHFPESAEIHCMAVLPELHRQGIGRMLVSFAKDELRGHGVKFLQVKTQGPSKPNEHYARTIAFYRGMGFAPLEEFLGFWNGLPCLLLAKSL